MSACPQWQGLVWKALLRDWPLELPVTRDGQPGGEDDRATAADLIQARETEAHAKEVTRGHRELREKPVKEQCGCCTHEGHHPALGGLPNSLRRKLPALSSGRRQETGALGENARAFSCPQEHRCARETQRHPCPGR